MSPETFGQFIARKRKERGWATGTDFAAVIGQRQQQVNRWERDEQRPRPGVLPLLAEKLLVPLEELRRRYDEDLYDSEKRAKTELEEVLQAAEVLKVFAEQYEEFHGEYRRLTERVDWLVTNFQKQQQLLERLVRSRSPEDGPVERPSRGT